MQYCKAIILPLKINLKNTDARIFHKTSVDWIPRIVRHDHRVWPTPGMQRWFNAGKSVNGIHLIDTRKEKNPMSVFFIPAEEASDKIQHSIQVEILGNRGNFLNLIKVNCEKLTADITINGENLIAFPLRPGARKGCPLSSWTLYLRAWTVWKDRKMKLMVNVRKEELRKFPGSPGAKTPCSQCRRAGFHPCSRN